MKYSTLKLKMANLEKGIIEGEKRVISLKAEFVEICKKNNIDHKDIDQWYKNVNTHMANYRIDRAEIQVGNMREKFIEYRDEFVQKTEEEVQAKMQEIRDMERQASNVKYIHSFEIGKESFFD